jgi:pimeloyl-ACP methyl ester carboxylesterase
MAEVAEKISVKKGVIEALQTRSSISDLLVELHGLATLHGHPPLTLIGHSWGAWLSLLFASKHPDLVRKLILVASGPLEEKYAGKIMETRLSRLNGNDAETLTRLMHQINLAHASLQDTIFLEIAELTRKADACRHDGTPYRKAAFEYRNFESVWSEAERLRASGELLQETGKVTCPVLAIHGDYDPHPSMGVKLSLEEKIKDFRFILLKKCGHEPWSELLARDLFFNILEQEI